MPHFFSEKAAKRIANVVKTEERKPFTPANTKRQKPVGVSAAGTTIKVAQLTEELTVASAFLSPSTATAQPVKKNSGGIWYVDNDEDEEIEITNRDTTLSVPEDSFVWYCDVMGENHIIYVGCIQTNEIQRLRIVGTPTGGTFTLRYEDQSTSGIAYNASASTVESALEALSNIGSNNVRCTGGPLPTSEIEIEFIGDLAATNVPLLGYNAAGLTGGTSPSIVTEVLVGGCCEEV